MSELNVHGVTVRFPFTPYDCQRDYMSRVIECLQQKKNGILESPTGTGKTLCLLCATLAWREHFKDTISARKIADQLKGAEMFPNTPLASWGNAATDGDSTTYYTDIPKIIYASRTHSQLAQVISELKNTTYRPKVCVLGSREQLCVNPEVMRQESNHVKVHMCRAKVSTRSCVYYNNVEEKSTDCNLTNSILDVEDLVKYGSKQRVCPYYLSRTLKQQADIIFMPYNYLLDPKSRRAHNIELSKAVVIFDEAHNVERTCEESTSFDLTPYDMASAITAVDRLLVEQTKEVSRGDGPSESFSADLLSTGQTLHGFYAEVPPHTAHTADTLIQSVNRSGCSVPQSISVSSEQGLFLNTTGLQKLADIIQVLHFATQYIAISIVHIHQDISQKRKQPTDLWTSSTSKKQGNILSYWCFSPGFSMQELVNQGVRCIILTSGTLSPLSSFTSEMRIDFPIHLENGHVIERDQIFVSVIERGPDGVQLTSAFDRRFLPENMASLGSTVANLSRVVPHGLLVFFPSYPLMEKTLEFWREKGQADRIEHVKPMFVEPKGKGTFTEVIEGYYNKVDNPVSKGGSFFAVCRGKASEGLDFADSYGRGVIITGLPFPPKMDPRIILKMQFLDEMCRKKTPGQYLTGQEWYRQQAFRAVNQAVGRVIRHKEDYGAIFLCDERFKGANAIAQLPKWVRPYVRPYIAFGSVVRDVSQFFRVAQKIVSVQYLLPLFCVCVDDPSGSNGLAKICINYESGAPEIHRRPTSLLDALEQDQLGGQGDESWVGEEKASRLSTLSLQYDKRIDEELRGGKRKIKLVHEQVCTKHCSCKASRAKGFLAEMKKTLSQVHFERIIQALQTYKKTDDLDTLLRWLLLFVGATGLYQFVRPHHKQRFDDQCRQCTGQSCGFKPDHSLSKEDKKALIQQVVLFFLSCCRKWLVSCSLVNTQHLNQGGAHLSPGLNSQPAPPHLTTYPSAPHSLPLQSSQRSRYFKICFDREDLELCANLVSSEKSAQFFQAIRSYKQTDNYEQLVSVVVSLLTERDEDFHLLARFRMFLRSHHVAQYKDMLDSLIGQTKVPSELCVLKEQPADSGESFFFLSRHTRNSVFNVKMNVKSLYF
uniref:Regulator of telomere elongation helicase 1 n=1 Tax=Periophthalmus magnuspinnatus TaxID=409849 RepID=A0A3B4BKS9_9GOBI